MSNIVSNVAVYGLTDSVKASKYPMSVDTKSCNSDVTSTVCKLAAAKPGSGHDQFLTGIIAQFDLTFTIKAWVEAERYHFLDFVSSQSTMHRICKFDMGTAYNEYVDPQIIATMRRLVWEYNENPTSDNYLRVLYSNPCGMKLTARITTNYRQLKTIYNQRKYHRLPEWRDFCAWVETLPLAEFITGAPSESHTEGETESI